MMPRTLSLALLLLLPLACDSSKPAEGDKKEDKKEDKKAAEGKAAEGKADGGKAAEGKADGGAAPKADEGAALPTETETVALDQGESKIPATIDVPKGCTTFNDDPTTIRVDHGEARDGGKLFGVQIAKGNEFNTNLAEIEKGMLENKFGNTNEILEKTDTLLRYTMKREGDDANHKFSMIVDIGGEKWVCKDGNYGGYDEAASKRQIEACQTLKAK